MSTTGWPPSRCTRTGRVLMNRPIIDSTPGSSGGRPATVVPKTTSSRPVSRASSRAHMPWSTVFVVRPRPRVSSVSRRVRSSLSSKRMRSGTAGARTSSAGTTLVGSSTPASSARHAARAAALSWRSSQVRYSR